MVLILSRAGWMLHLPRWRTILLREQMMHAPCNGLSKSGKSPANQTT